MIPAWGRPAAGTKIGDDFQIIFGHKTAYGEFTLDHHGQRGGLDAPHGKLFVIGEGVGARQIHAHQPVCPATAARRIGQPVVVSPWPQGLETLTDGRRREGRDPQPAERLPALRRLVNIAEDQLSLAPGVGRAHYARNPRRVEDSSYDFELILGVFVDNQRPMLGQDGEQVAPPVAPFRVDFVRLGKGYEMPNRPRHHVAVAVQISIAPAGCTQFVRDIARHRGLFG